MGGKPKGTNGEPSAPKWNYGECTIGPKVGRGA